LEKLVAFSLATLVFGTGDRELFPPFQPLGIELIGNGRVQSRYTFEVYPVGKRLTYSRGSFLSSLDYGILGSEN
jgi:hypothetical protein